MTKPASDARLGLHVDHGRVARRLWTAAWLALVVAVSVLYLLPGAAPPGAYQADKMLHLAAFAAIGFPLRFMTWRRGAFLALAALSVAIGVALEAIQSIVPGRVYSSGDIAANVVGVGIGVIAAAVVARRSGTP